MSKVALVVVLLLVGLLAKKQVPELQRYMKIRNM